MDGLDGLDGGDLAELGLDLRRVADRLRSLSDVRLRQPSGRGATRADAALDLAQRLAEAAQGVEERAAPAPPAWRVVPDLGVFALGDQIAVTGTDLVDALAAVRAEETVWTREGRRPAGAVRAEVAAAVRAFRLAL